MYWQFTNGSATTTADLSGSVTWRTPGGGNAGEASVFVPFGITAASPTYINPDTGSSLVVPSQGGAGVWRGIVTKVETMARGISVTAHQPWLLLTSRLVRAGVTLTQTSPGVVVGYALRDGLAGIGGLYMGAAAYESDAPSIESYTLNRQSAWSVITDMMALSEGELHVDADTGRCDWLGPFALAPLYGGLLVAGPDMHNVTVSKESTTRVAEVIATYEDDAYHVVRGEVAAQGNWPAQATVSASGGGAALVSAAQGGLAAANTPQRFITADLPDDHWSIRERQYVRVLVPWLDITGGIVACRVLERSRSSNSPHMRVKLQIVNSDTTYPYTANAARQQRTGRNRNSAAAVAEIPNLRRAIEVLQSG